MKPPRTFLATSLLLASVAMGEAADEVSFRTDVVPLLTKLGCNAGGCHGKATGQNGFRLSLLGYEPEFDREAIVHEARGRRVNLASPPQSLVLLKGTGIVPHGGGKRFDVGSEDYGILYKWIERGAGADLPTDPVLKRIALAPQELVFDVASRQIPLTVTAHFSDGTTRDVTKRAVYQSNEPELADVTDAGSIEVKNRSGLFAVMVRYGDEINVFHGTVPVSTRTLQTDAALNDWETRHAKSFVDRLLVAQWRRLGIRPSEFATDAEFIRRASLDLCGTLPTPEEVDAYLADTRTNKRARLIDRLLERPEYASVFALKWADILRNRGRGYSTSRQRPGTALFAGWIRDRIAENVPYDRFAAEILTSSGSQETNPPAVWHRTVRSTQDYVESVAQAFLGVRIQCAQCHHHPAERWSQDDYYGLAAVFARVGRKGGFADAEVPTNEVIYLADTGEVVHPRTGKTTLPRPLGGPDFSLTRYDDPRRALAKWMTSRDNSWFARTMANRMWGHFFGRGIIHPIDDARSTNPPSNPELLDALTASFTGRELRDESRSTVPSFARPSSLDPRPYDVKALIRTICNSSAYALSSLPNESNRDDSQSFSRFAPRRLPAEVLLDALAQVLEAPTTFANVSGPFPAGTRAIDLPDEAVPSHFLDVFGRPARNSACECERVDAPSLGQTLELVSSNELQQKLTAAGGYVEKLGSNAKPHVENVSDIFCRVFARPPSEKEAAAATAYLESHQGRKEAYGNLLWALLATNEFLFNH